MTKKRLKPVEAQFVPSDAAIARFKTELAKCPSCPVCHRKVVAGQKVDGRPMHLSCQGQR